ncbi:MAG: type II toxin-antitoxin system YafQ family toxin [Eubacterium sp.]|nr:type II toxin-antitoxin system YafQ family toxin [Eubacterium sp.]
MLEVSYTGRFKKDYKACIRRGYDLVLLKDVIASLSIPEKLPEKNKDHDLKGDYIGKRECHILPDWLLVYKIEGERLILYRTGTHSDLFKK